MAVQGQSLILHWNGVTWLQVPSPSPGNFTELTGVRAVSASDAWVVGFTGSPTQALAVHLKCC